jgi:hypothetical protein
MKVAVSLRIDSELLARVDAAEGENRNDRVVRLLEKGLEPGGSTGPVQAAGYQVPLGMRVAGGLGGRLG